MKMKLPLPKPPPKAQKKMSLAEMNKTLDQASKNFRVAIFKGDYEDAYKKILPAYQLVPQHPNILMDLAFTELRLQKFELAYEHYLCTRQK